MMEVQTLCDDVVILLATHNGSQHLGEQLASISEQTYPAWQLVVSDDSSTDETFTVLTRFAERHPARVTILDPISVGSAKANFFRLLHSAPDASYYAFCDQDDVWERHKLERLVTVCRASEAADSTSPRLVYSDLAVVDQTLLPIASSFMKEIAVDTTSLRFGTLLVENAVPGCSMLFNRATLKLFRQYKGSPENAIMHDWWIALLVTAFGRMSYVDEPLVQYRQHSNNVTGSVRRRGVGFAIEKLRAAQRNDVPKTYPQARELHDAYRATMPSKPAEILDAYVSFPRLGKLARIRACYRNGILKQSFTRRAYQVVSILRGTS